VRGLWRAPHRQPSPPLAFSLPTFFFPFLQYLHSRRRMRRADRPQNAGWPRVPQYYLRDSRLTTTHGAGAPPAQPTHFADLPTLDGRSAYPRRSLCLPSTVILPTLDAQCPPAKQPQKPTTATCTFRASSPPAHPRRISAYPRRLSAYPRRCLACPRRCPAYPRRCPATKAQPAARGQQPGACSLPSSPQQPTQQPIQQATSHQGPPPPRAPAPAKTSSLDARPPPSALVAEGGARGRRERAAATLRLRAGEPHRRQHPQGGWAAREPVSRPRRAGPLPTLDGQGRRAALPTLDGQRAAQKARGPSQGQGTPPGGRPRLSAAAAPGKSRRRRADPQQIVTTRLLYCLQDPFAQLSRLQRI
jgi:hypothetical protein